MIRLVVVGRREEPVYVAVPSLFEGQPPTFALRTQVLLHLLAVDDKGQVVTPDAAGVVNGGKDILIPVRSLDELDEYKSGELYGIIPL